MNIKVVWLILCVSALTACWNDWQSAADKNQQSQSLSNSEKRTITDITSDALQNPVAYIPPQCYVDPTASGQVQNSCYACHTDSKRPNYLNDTDVQKNYNFPDTGLKNHWLNSFKDRSQDIANIKDQTIDDYVAQDNYKSANGEIILAEKLNNIPTQWDRNQNGKWDGYIPDVNFIFDDAGFDLNSQGQYSGWRAFAYYPMLGSFMPTNGSSDDVLIRLPLAFRQNSDGQFDLTIYKINLAIVESLMKEQDISIDEIDENLLDVDLNQDGELGLTDNIKFDHRPLDNHTMSYVGLAKALLDNEQVHLAIRLYPEGTEFLHSVRYLAVANETVSMAMRMKELRYSKKQSWRNYNQLRTIVNKEVKERHDFPGRTKSVIGNMETGLTVAQGWTYQGFIEDQSGALRPQNYEETYACTGCHGYIGANNDTTIAFARKFSHDAFQKGWYHWLTKPLAGIQDPKREDGESEYAYYLKHNPKGSEFANNQPVYKQFFDENGQAKTDAFAALEKDINVLLTPSAQRARILNKAYKVIVQEQSFIYGRDAHVAPLEILQDVKSGQATGIEEILSFY